MINKTSLRFRENQGIWSADEIERADAAITTWTGTPWRNRMAKIGVGIDCLNLVREITEAAGVLPPFRFPCYSFATGIRATANICEPFFLECCFARRIEPGEASTDGDIVIFRSGAISNHVGIVFGGRLVHAPKAGVLADALEAVKPERIQSFVRLTGRGFQRRPETITSEDISRRIAENK